MEFQSMIEQAKHGQTQSLRLQAIQALEDQTELEATQALIWVVKNEQTIEVLKAGVRALAPRKLSDGIIDDLLASVVRAKHQLQACVKKALEARQQMRLIKQDQLTLDLVI